MFDAVLLTVHKLTWCAIASFVETLIAGVSSIDGVNWIADVNLIADVNWIDDGSYAIGDLNAVFPAIDF
jgi:hypothetical protein